jgi:hypothetical protein
MGLSFDIKRSTRYMEVIVAVDNFVLSSGLLDEEESVSLAEELIYAAEQLLPERSTEEIGKNENLST